MNKTKSALRSAPACVLSLAFLAFAAPVAADHATDHSGHDKAATATHDHGTAKTEDHAAGHDHTKGHEAAASQDHTMGHGDHQTADHRMPDHLGMDDENTLGIAMSPDGFQYKRSTQDYQSPDVTLRDQNAHKVKFSELMDFDGPVLLNFIFTSCATICPVMSATFGQTQEDLVAIDPNYLMVSISIDPEYDTPSRLRDYADLHAARDNWVMLTGQFNDIFTVVGAFDAIYKGDNKMYHRPLTFLRASKNAPWLRLEGLLGSEELAGEYNKLLHPEVN